jgi:hypothetical protein
VDTIRTVTGYVTEDWCAPVVEPRRPGDPAGGRFRGCDPHDARLAGNMRVEDMVASAWSGWTAR